MNSLEDLVRELEETAARLRGGELEPAEAAELVERCAELATQVGSALDQAGRETAEGQGQLL